MIGTTRRSLRTPRMTPRTWQPDVYLTFEAYRARPVGDLLARVDIDGVAGGICDLGCGAGQCHRHAGRALARARITGLGHPPP